jgi:FG-GAP repeat
VAGHGIADPFGDRAGAKAPVSGAPPSRVASALIGTMPRRTRTIAAMFLFNGDTARLTNILTGPGNSLTGLFSEVSYGLQQYSVTTHGPITLPTTDCLTLVGDGPDPNTANGLAVSQAISALPMTSDHYFLLYTEMNGNCGFSSMARIGAPAQPAAYSIENSVSLVADAQALGANLGMANEPTMTCPGAQTLLDDPSACTHNKVGNRLSFMGSGAHHPSAYQKYAQGWIDKCNIVAVGASGKFNLVPQELPCDGVQLLQIPAPKVRDTPPVGPGNLGPTSLLSYYYAELRAPVGFDVGLAPMVLISIGPDVPTTTILTPQVYTLDMVPDVNGAADLMNMGLTTPGQTYSDPAGGLTITLVSISAQSATISVTTTTTDGNVCAGGTPFTAPGPEGSSCAALTIADGGVPVTGAAGTTATGGQAGGTGGASGTGGTTGTGGTGGATMGGSGGRDAGMGGRAGTGGKSALAGTDGGSSDAPGSQDGPAIDAPGGGCSCGTVPTPASAAEGLSFLVIAVVARRKRPRRDARGSHRRVGRHSAAPIGPDGDDSKFGSSVASAGDVNGDAHTDVIVGAPGADAGVSGLSTTPSVTLMGPDGPGGHFGSSVAGAE